MMNCKLCDKEYPKRMNLARHIVSAHKITTKEYALKFNITEWYGSCKECDREITNTQYQYCWKCYCISPERKTVSKKIVLARGDFNGENNPNYKGGLIEKICICLKQFKVYPARINTAKYCSTSCKKKHSVSKSKITEYKGHKMRSSWEVTLAKYFDSKGYTWKYEPESFGTSVGFYTPDFWVEELQSYFEVEGFFRDKESKIKFEEFSISNTVVLADLNYFKSLGFERIKYGPNKGQLWQPADQL
jgi:hypothetical protein